MVYLPPREWDFGSDADGDEDGYLEDEDGKQDYGDEDDGALARVEVGLGVDVDDGGEEERQGLAASRLRDGDDVAPGEGGGPGLRLNRGGGGETRARKLRGDVRGEGSLLERVRGFRGIAAGDGDVVSRAEGFLLRPQLEGLVHALPKVREEEVCSVRQDVPCVRVKVDHALLRKEVAGRVHLLPKLSGDPREVSAVKAVKDRYLDCKEGLGLNLYFELF